MPQTTETIMAAVVEGLKARGVTAYLEYPGYISIPVGTITLDCGTANGTWDCDCVDFDDNVVETIESTLPGDCADVERIVNHLTITYTECERAS